MLKKQIKQYLLRTRDEQYERELLDKVDSYSNWYRLHKLELDKRLNAADHTEGRSFLRRSFGILTSEITSYPAASFRIS